LKINKHCYLLHLVGLDFIELPLLFVSVTDITVQLIFPFLTELYVCLE
jgi:hypothetical protein